MKGFIITLSWLTFWWLVIAAFTSAGTCRVAWNASPTSENVTGYRVWRGIEVLAEVSGTSATITLPDAPSTLTVTAVNAFGESTHSAPLELVTLIVQDSADLREWQPVQTIHVEKHATRFYRIQLP